MAKISTRSTAELTAYVRICDRLRAIEEERKSLERAEKLARPGILAEIGDTPRPVTIRGALRILRADVSRTCSIVDDGAALEFARAHGLKISPPRPERVETMTLRSLALDGVIPPGIVEVKSTPIIVVE